MQAEILDKRILREYSRPLEPRDSITCASPPTDETTHCFTHLSFYVRQSRRSMQLEIHPPLPAMEAKSVDSVPVGDQWQYEPKWDGFRCLAFCEGSKIELQSKSMQPLSRYFPELIAALGRLKSKMSQVLKQSPRHFGYRQHPTHHSCLNRRARHPFVPRALLNSQIKPGLVVRCGAKLRRV
jgi:hypothetical protein